MPDSLLTTRDVQEYLNVDRITVYRMVESGQIPGMKVGGQWRFSGSAIEEWLRSRSGKPQTAAQVATPAPALAPSEALDLASRPLEVLRVADLVAPSCLEIIQGSFAQALGVAVGITDLAGKLIVPMSNPCAFCQIGWSSADFLQRCQSSWAALSTLREPQPGLYPCHAGLLYAAAPVIVGERSLGLVVVGQFLAQPAGAEALHRFRLVSAELGLDSRLLVDRAREIRVMPPDRVELVSKLLVTIASALSEIASQNYHVRLKLAQIAKIVGTD